MTNQNFSPSHPTDQPKTEVEPITLGEQLMGSHERSNVCDGIPDSSMIEKEVASECLDGLAGEVAPSLDGSVLSKVQFDALKMFAESNKVDIAKLLSNVTIENGLITEAQFADCGLTSLEFLRPITSIRVLDISENQELESLKGVPTEALEELIADSCNLKGLSPELNEAKGLRRLSLWANFNLGSFKGIPYESLEELVVSSCGLTGDLQELQPAVRLRVLDVHGNPGIVSLEGVPSSVQSLDARNCDIRGDLAALQNLASLKALHVSYNQGLTSLQGIRSECLVFLSAESCGLEGNHNFLAAAKELRALYLSENTERLILDLNLFDLKRTSVQL